MIPRKNYFRDISPIWTLHFPIQDSSANSSIPAAAPVPAEFDAAQVSFESTTRGVQTPDLPAPGGEPGQPPLQPQHEDDLLPLHTTPGAKQAKDLPLIKTLGLQLDWRPLAAGGPINPKGVAVISSFFFGP